MTRPTAIRRPAGRAGFTLLEMMVSCVVFMLLSALLLQVFGTISKANDGTHRRSEILGQAIGALERVNYDLKSAVRSGGANMAVLKSVDSDHNDALIFVSSVSSAGTPAATRNLSVVEYGITAKPAGDPDFSGWPDVPAFSRTVRTFAWGDDLGSLLPFTSITAAAAVAGGTTQQISPGVIRCEICFQLWDGSVVAAPPSDWSQVRALVCGIVVVDRKTAASLVAAGQPDLASYFPKADDGQLPCAAWNGVIAKLPPAARQTVRIYEYTLSI
jgi:type II secretory pathway pseudopilin PulG